MILVQGASPSGETIGFQASNLVLDGKQGRITLEPALLEYAGIDRELEAVRAGRSSC